MLLRATSSPCIDLLKQTTQRMGTSYPIISQHTKTCSYSRNFQSYKLRDTKLKVHKICRAIRRSSLKSTLSSLERILKIFIDRFGNRNVSEAIKTLYSIDVCKRDGRVSCIRRQSFLISKGLIRGSVPKSVKLLTHTSSETSTKMATIFSGNPIRTVKRVILSADG